MPDSFKPVPPGADYERGLLAALGAVAHGCKVVTKYLKPVKQIIKILDLCHWAQSSHGHAKSLPEDGGLPYTGIENAQFTILFLKAFHGLVHTTYLSYIFPKCTYQRVILKDMVEIHFQYFPSGDGRCIISIFWKNLSYLECRLLRFAPEMCIIGFMVFIGHLITPGHDILF